MTALLLSTGDPSTLGNYRNLCKIVGFDKAAAYFEEMIKEQGEDSEVIQHESQMMLLIAAIERGNTE